MKAIVQKTIAKLIHHHRDGAASRDVVELDPAGATLLLRGGQFIRIDGRAGWQIRALGGTVWITQDGDLRDVVLESGQSFTPDRDSHVLISPLGEARVCLTRGGECGKVVRNAPAPVFASGHARAVAA